MTLGGLALSVGILVDQAIVTIENIERHLHMGTELKQAILVGAGEIGVPAFVSTLCICIVFVPMFFLSGVARFCSCRSRRRWFRDDCVVHPVANAGADAGDAVDARRAREPVEGRVCCNGCIADSMRNSSVCARLHVALGAARAEEGFALCSSVFACCRACCIRSWAGLLPERGRRPDSPAHARATGTRIEETARLADDVEAAIRRIVPPDQLETILDNLGVPNSGINLSYSNAGTIGTLDGEILLSLKPDHRPTEEFVDDIARRTAEAVPRHRVLLPARGHRHADPELRATGGNRCSIYRRQSRAECGACRRTAEIDQDRFRARSMPMSISAWTDRSSICRWIGRGCSRSA